VYVRCSYGMYGTYKSILGVDPGASGGFACWRDNKSFTACGIPATEGDQIQLIRELIAPGETIAFVEQVGGFIGKGQPGSAMFSFGRNFGFILGVMQALGVRIELVRPQKWQKSWAWEASGCASRSEWKNKLKSCAQRLFPLLKPTLSTADALLILSYGLKSLRHPGYDRC
jgi:crossover junction endodeoxyribonuclease RuvC